MADPEAQKQKGHEPPKPGIGDAAHAVARAGLSAIPLVGGAAVELFTAVVTPPLERRRTQWMEDIGESLHKLELEKGVVLETLRQNDAFLDTVLAASQAALRTSHAEKKSALRNAILNSALPNPPEASLQQLFVSIVDSFTIWHLRLLKLFQDPPAWAARNNHKFPTASSLAQILESAFPDLAGRRSFYDQVWRDIWSRGLTNTDGLHTMMTQHGPLERRATELGEQFLRFVEDPG